LKPGEQLDIERLGGLAGMGLPGSRIRSLARFQHAELSAAEHAAVTQAFAGTPPENPQLRDGFRYRLTVSGPAGQRSVEVGEAHVPESLRDRISDELI